MHNLRVNDAEREARQPLAMENESLEAWSGPVDGMAAFTHDTLEQLDDRLAAALQELPEDYQIVMLLWAVEEFSYKEIAEAVSIPIGTVMSRLHRARRRLAESLRTVADASGKLVE